MKTLYVCGDSFLTPSASCPNTHFSEIIAKKLGYELKVLAHGGMSNNGICLQIEASINNDASFVIVSPTYYDRIDVPILDKKTPYDINDVFYPNTSYINFEDNANKLLACGLLEYENYGIYSPIRRINGIHKISNQLKDYINNLYNPIWKQQQDNWALYAALHKLHISTIPYIIVLDKHNITKEFTWLTEKNVTLPYNDIKDRVNNIDIDPGYHTSPKDQLFIAEKLLSHIDKFKILN